MSSPSSSSVSTTKPPPLSPKPNPEVVKRFSFTKKSEQQQQQHADQSKTKSTSAAPDSRRIEEDERVDENALFRSLEPAEVKGVDEAFERLTSEVEVDPSSEKKAFEQQQASEVSDSTSSAASNNIPFADEDASSIVTPPKRSIAKDEHSKSNDDSGSSRPAATKDATVTESVSKPVRVIAAMAPEPPVARQDSATTATTSEDEDVGGHNSRSSSLRQTAEVGEGPPHVPLDSGSEADEFQDEIHFDPTVSSGHLAYKGDGGFRNTPITRGGGGNNAEKRQGQNNDSSLVDEMTPTEAEIMLSTELRRNKEQQHILSDEQAEEVVALLTPEKELPPLPLGEANKEEPVTSSDIGSSIDSWTTNRQGSAVPPESALDKLDHLVYNKTTVELRVNEEGNAAAATKEGDAVEEEESLVSRAKEAFYDEVNDVHVLEDGHYWFEIPAIDGSSSAEELPEGCYKAPSKLRFSDVPIKQVRYWHLQCCTRIIIIDYYTVHTMKKWISV